jgi:hypothetical protein
LRSNRLAILILAALLAGGCSKKSGTAKGSPALPTPQDEANLLGRDVFAAMDAVLSYRSAHQGRMPVSLRQVGVDSLSRLIIRRLSARGSVPMVTAVFRSLDGRQLASCRGTSEVQEEASLNGGTFTVSCLLRSGEESGYKIQGSR